MLRGGGRGGSDIRIRGLVKGGEFVLQASEGAQSVVLAVRKQKQSPAIIQARFGSFFPTVG